MSQLHVLNAISMMYISVFELERYIIIIGIVEKAQETSSDTGMHSTVHVCHYTVLHEQCIDINMSWNAEKHPHRR